MTADELRQWKSWLLEQGRNPPPIAVDSPKSGSVYTYDRQLEAVVESAADGSLYVIAVRDGQTERVRKLTAFREDVIPQRYRPFRLHLALILVLTVLVGLFGRHILSLPETGALSLLGMVVAAVIFLSDCILQWRSHVKKRDH